MKNKNAAVLKRLTAAAILIMMLFSICVPSYAATAEEWVENWDTLKNDSTAVALMPGSDSSEMRFTWLSGTLEGFTKLQISDRADMKDGKKITATSTFTGIYGYKNAVSVTGLKADTTYYYRVSRGLKWSEVYSFKTANDKNFNVMFVSDTQIGRSGDEKLDEVLQHDSLGWNNTLEAAQEYASDISLILSAGDQVETGITQEQYNLFFAPKAMRSIPVATALGNHDFYYPLYSVRTNNPNQFDRELLQAPAGKGYYFKKGEALFIVINSNNFLTCDHEELIKEAMEFYPDALWRVVLMHHSIYSRKEENNFSRPIYYPLFDKYNIDLVLSGHDHMYLRSARLYNNEIVKTGGTVYIEANTASGCNYDGVPDALPWYAEACAQPRVPTYTMLNFTKGKISIKTLRSDSNEVIDEFDMTKAAPTKTVIKDSLLKKLYDVVANVIFTVKDVIASKLG